MADVLTFARIRPLGDAGSFLRFPTPSSIALPSTGFGSSAPSFQFDRVFQTGATQADVFGPIAAPVERVLEGRNVALLVFGQALAGKRWTLLGDLDGSDANLGLVPRSLAHLFRNLGCTSSHAAAEWEVRLSWVEVFGEQLFDLLADSEERQIAESAARGTHAEGLREVVVSSADEAVGWLRRGAARRQQQISHSIISVRFERRLQDGSCVMGTLVALECTPSLGAAIKSLGGAESLTSHAQASSALAQTVAAVAVAGSGVGGVLEREAVSSAHRGSKLTRLLVSPGVLGGSCALVAIACASPSKEHKDTSSACFKLVTDCALMPNAALLNERCTPEELQFTATALQTELGAIKQYSRIMEGLLESQGIQPGGLAPPSQGLAASTLGKFSRKKKGQAEAGRAEHVPADLPPEPSAVLVSERFLLMPLQNCLLTPE